MVLGILHQQVMTEDDHCHANEYMVVNETVTRIRYSIYFSEMIVFTDVDSMQKWNFCITSA